MYGVLHSLVAQEGEQEGRKDNLRSKRDKAGDDKQKGSGQQALSHI